MTDRYTDDLTESTGHHTGNNLDTEDPTSTSRRGEDPTSRTGDYDDAKVYHDNSSKRDRDNLASGRDVDDSGLGGGLASSGASDVPLDRSSGNPGTTTEYGSGLAGRDDDLDRPTGSGGGYDGVDQPSGFSASGIEGTGAGLTSSGGREEGFDRPTGHLGTERISGSALGSSGADYGAGSQGVGGDLGSARSEGKDGGMDTVGSSGGSDVGGYGGDTSLNDPTMPSSGGYPSGGDTSGYSGGSDTYGSDTTGGLGAGNGNKPTNASYDKDDTKGEDVEEASTLGKIMEQAGGILKSEKIEEKGHEKREAQRESEY